VSEILALHTLPPYDRRWKSDRDERGPERNQVSAVVAYQATVAARGAREQLAKLVAYPAGSSTVTFPYCEYT
jgi:hypothetical protein